MTAKRRNKARTVVGENPLEGEQLLLDALYGGPAAAAAPTALAPVKAARRPKPVEPPPKPQHYKIISISLYNEDIERLEGLVKELKQRGYHKANKSQVIREALALLDLDRVSYAR